MQNLYTAQQIKKLDKKAQDLGLSEYLLINRAASFAFSLIQQYFPKAKTLGILCGSGNNAADGYALAIKAKTRGYTINLFQLTEPNFSEAGKRLQQEALDFDIAPTQLTAEALLASHLLIDAIFGIGLNRPLNQDWEGILELINLTPKPKLALDISTGIDATTGEVLGYAVKADITASFIAPKLGQAINAEYSGKVIENNLDIKVPAITPEATSWQTFPKTVFRNQVSHKGSYGKALLIGGDFGKMGAIALCGQACLRTGSGVVSIISRKDHAAALTQIQPELMCHDEKTFNRLANQADVIAIGTGLGQEDWGWDLFEKVCATKNKLILDADALNCLAVHPFHYDDWILTPHPGEAARMLDRPIQAVQRDRVASIKALQKRYGGTVVLKGSRTLIFDGKQLAVCQAGNAGMATAGTGDILTGIIASQVAQSKELFEAAQYSVELHARLGDLVAQEYGETSLIASDLIQPKFLSQLLNPLEQK